ncbi:MAG: SMP-30/gluconolactonase/LRE family protein, partial [Phaeodactylibacter sp.]|nr:SMP-30/gluconolactonase/LRE family protein [Phaeodactylibacter sp.]
MKYDIQPLFAVKCHHGEGPVWDPQAQQFYWVDLMQGQFFIGDWATQRVETHVVGQPLGVLALREQGGIVMALRDGFFTYDPHERNLNQIAPTE